MIGSTSVIHTIATRYNSRMTIAHLIETLLGKQGLQTGHEGDATPFIECTVAEISKNLHQVSNSYFIYYYSQIKHSTLYS